jgi:hypothetical protein
VEHCHLAEDVIPTGQAPEPDATRYGDPNPVPAARELLETGTLGKVPSTRLVDAPSGDVYRLGGLCGRSC